jgi:hypothetical protein
MAQRNHHAVMGAYRGVPTACLPWAWLRLPSVVLCGEQVERPSLASREEFLDDVPMHTHQSAVDAEQVQSECQRKSRRSVAWDPIGMRFDC